MVSVVNWQPANGLMAQTDRLGPKVGGHLALCCIHLPALACPCNDDDDVRNCRSYYWLIVRGSAVYHCTSSSLMCVSVNRYITSTWQLNCVGSSAVSCQQGSNLTQRFTVSSSVNFILVPDTTPQPPTTWVHCHHVERWTLFIRQVSGWDKSGAN